MVLFIKESAEVSFDNSLATLSALTTLFIFGQPLTVEMSERDKSQFSDSMARRGLVLSTVKAHEAGAKKDSETAAHACTCGPLRP